jgi:short-subunit dehydrogenase
MTASVVATSPLVFITGASSGLGQALAARYYAAGWRLALVARRTEATQAWVRSQAFSNERVAVYAADVRQVDSIVAAGRACMDQQGLPDVVIANAGISIGVDLSDAADLQVMREIFETNNIGLAATFHPFITPMCERRRGTLVGIASVAGIRGLPGHAAYTASKAGVINMCESLRIELKADGVQVVTIAPGYIDTPMTRENPFSMPFLISADVFAERAFKAIEHGVSYRVIPWQMGVVAKLLRIMPNAWLDYLAARRGRKPRAAPPG